MSHRELCGIKGGRNITFINCVFPVYGETCMGLHCRESVNAYTPSLTSIRRSDAMAVLSRVLLVAGYVSLDAVKDEQPTCFRFCSALNWSGY